MARPSHDHANHDHHRHHQHDEAGAMTATDPVCGMKVDPHTIGHRASDHGQTYYFCSAKCREKFVANPKQYLVETRKTEQAPAGTIYTCPMHPEIRQAGSGSCPICGMTLEPERASPEEGPSP